MINLIMKMILNNNIQIIMIINDIIIRCDNNYYYWKIVKVNKYNNDIVLIWKR
jgi:hypothetical protein